jgi:ribosome maturation factor RimP
MAGGFMNRSEYEERTQKLLVPILQQHGFELVDVEFVKEGSSFYLRSYIDKPGGINVDDCETVSRALEAKLDEEDFIPDAYTLIVSSPGLGRVLKRPRDFEFAMGKEVEVKLYKAVDGEKEFSGILKSADGKTVKIESDDKSYEFQRAEISLIRLAFDF